MDDKTYALYDATVLFLIRDIADHAQDSEYISLGNFSPKSREHLVVFNAALYSASLSSKKVVLNMPFWSYLKFRLTHRVMKGWYKNHGCEPNVDVPHEIGEVYNNINDEGAFKTGIGCIYDEYYNPKKGK